MDISIFEEETTTLYRYVQYQSFCDGDRKQRNANDELSGNRNTKKRWSYSEVYNEALQRIRNSFRHIFIIERVKLVVKFLQWQRSSGFETWPECPLPCPNFLVFFSVLANNLGIIPDIMWRPLLCIFQFGIYISACYPDLSSLSYSATPVNIELLKTIVGVLTTCHTQYTSFSICNPMWFLAMGLRQGSGLCSSSSHKYPGTEGTNQNHHWNHHRWHATNSLERTRLSCWCL